MEAPSSDFFPFFWTSNATPYDADTYCRIPEAKVDQSMKSFGPDVAKKKNYWKKLKPSKSEEAKSRVFVNH